MTTGWTVVIPVKSLDRAKSRLLRGDNLTERAGLALAFAIDVVTAVSASVSVDEVVVVTSDRDVADRLGSLGARIVGDPRSGLNGAASAGVTTALGAVAVLTGDLPALRAADLESALTEAARFPLTFVPDRQGTGTTMLTALDRRGLHPRFGVGSAELHRRAGHTMLSARASMRTDVDTADDLSAAIALGVGAATKAALGG